jgi:hypothetical protein
LGAKYDAIFVMSRAAKAAQKSVTSARFAASMGAGAADVTGIASAAPVIKNWERVMALV